MSDTVVGTLKYWALWNPRLYRRLTRVALSIAKGVSRPVFCGLYFAGVSAS